MVPDKPTEGGNRLLLVSYHYPPSEAAGALRWQRLTPVAAQHGWQTHVIALAPGQAERVDWARVGELPASTRIHGVPRVEPLLAHTYRVWRWLRGPRRQASQSIQPAEGPPTIHRDDVSWFAGGFRALVRAFNVMAVHLRDQGWMKLAVQTGLRVGRQFRPDIVLSCGPPHLVHEAGRRLAAAFGVPFVMDMRDPWSLQTLLHEERASPLWHYLAHRGEARCVRDASLVVMNTPNAARAMQQAWPRARIISVLNGWDKEPLPRLPWPPEFRIVYAGSIYLDRTPRPLFRAVARVSRELGLGPEKIQIRLIGNVEAFGRESVTAIAAQEGVPEYLRVIPPLSRREVLEEYAQAAVLVSLPQDSNYAIPSKLFEYMCHPCWIVAQSAEDSAVGQLLKKSGAFLTSPEDSDGLAQTLLSWYQEFLAGRRPEPSVGDTSAADAPFSRAAEGAKLMAALESLLAPLRRGSEARKA